MSYQATILADSVSPEGVRLTTLWVTFPRFILSELNTHRMLSRNSNSSRAIPPERHLSSVMTDPFVPSFNSRVKGMGVGDPLDEDDERLAISVWLDARDHAVRSARNLLTLDVDKSRVNRLLEPFLWHSAVVSATEWDNFFALRDHPAAQPEFQILARMMREAMEASDPLGIGYGEWHLPGTRDFPMMDSAPDWNFWKHVSAGRLARWTSYDLCTDDPPDTAAERAEKLIASFHLSPTEHQATPFKSLSMGGEFCGNLRGWKQFRKEIPNEHNAALARNLT